MIRIKTTTKLVACLGDPHAIVSVGVVGNLLVLISLGTLYIDPFIAGMFLLERKIVHVLSSSVAIFVSYSYDKATNAMVTYYAEKEYNEKWSTNKREPEQTHNWSNPVRTAKNASYCHSSNPLFLSQYPRLVRSISTPLQMLQRTALRLAPKASWKAFQTSRSKYQYGVSPLSWFTYWKECLLQWHSLHWTTSCRSTASALQKALKKRSERKQQRQIARTSPTPRQSAQ